VRKNNKFIDFVMYGTNITTFRLKSTMRGKENLNREENKKSVCLKCGGSEWIYKRRKRIREPNVAFKSQEDIKMLADNVTVFTSII
jgi:hypothetical protein